MPPLSYRGGFTSIKSGIGVAEFTSLDRDLPRKVVTQGLVIFFKYTGQLITCYRCGSTEYVVKNCPKQPSRFNHIHVEDHVLSAPPNPLIPRKCKKHRWKRLVQKILMMKFPRVLAARRYRHARPIFWGSFLRSFRRAKRGLAQMNSTFPS